MVIQQFSGFGNTDNYTILVITENWRRKPSDSIIPFVKAKLVEVPIFDVWARLKALTLSSSHHCFHFFSLLHFLPRRFSRINTKSSSRIWINLEEEERFNHL